MITRPALILLLMLFFLVSGLRAQEGKDISAMDYDGLYDKIDQYKGKKEIVKYLEAYLSKAKREKNTEEIINGYQNYVYEVEYSQKLSYADSMVYTAELTDNNEHIGSAILTKGIIYYSGKEYNKALDCYLKANRLAAKTGNEYLKYKIQYNIAHIKYYLGFYEEAISLFKRCAEFFSKEDTRAYLNCLHSLALCYTKVGNYQESAAINKLAMNEGIRLKDNSMVPYLYHSAGVNDYFKKDYDNAIKKINLSLPELEKQKDFANLSVAYFYLGSSYWDTKKKDKALPYLFKVDRIFMEKKYLRPDQRKNYEMLIDYYGNKGDRDAELRYINRLLEADTMLHENFRHISSKMFKEYDTAELIKERGVIQEELKSEKMRGYSLLLLSSILIPAICYLTYRNSRLRNYKKSFERYKLNSLQPEVFKSSKIQRPNIPEELEVELVKKLAKFEESFGFLKKDLKIEKLAVSFGTNYKYLSQVINYHKGSSYPEYISELRINYIVKKLEEDQKMRNYTFAAIAEEAGFGSAQQFADVFRKKMGMPLSYFLNKLST